jgi:pSer/pThr/pTyr-binding forkhead associated (FHA) protein
MAFLEVYIPDGKIEHFDLSKGSMTIGRSAEADISIQLPAISRIHARIEKSGKNRWIITDLDSRNKTIVDKHAIKSYVLTHKDVFYFGTVKVVFQDTSGASDEKAEQPVVVSKAKKTDVPPPKTIPCPRCKSEIPETAVICLTCGFNRKTGKSLELQVDGAAVNSPANTTGGVAAVSTGTASAPTKLLQNQTEIFMEWGLPAVLIVVSLIGMAAATGIPMTLAQAIGAVFRAAILFGASLVAAKLGEFGYNGIGNAILKFISIAMVLSAISAISMKSDWGLILSGGASLAALFCLLIVFFDTDMFGAFIVLMIMGAIEKLLFFMFMTAIFSWLSGTGGAEIPMQQMPTVPIR